MATAHRVPRRFSAAIGWEAVRVNLQPALILQALMLFVVLAYYCNARAAAALDTLAEYKRAHGVWFVVASAVLAASILPEIVAVIFFQGGRVRRQNFRNLLFTAPLWAFDGIIVDLLYRGLASTIGDRVTFSVVVTKICIDQFGYNVLFAAPYEVMSYEWKNSGYSFAALRGCLNFEYYRNKIVPTLFTTWVVWIPLVAMIYSLPLGLQFPLFSFALTFWVLLLTYMTNLFARDTAQVQAFAATELKRGGAQ